MQVTNLMSLSQQPLVGHSLTSDSQGFSEETWYKGIKSPSQIPGQSPSLTSIKQDWKHQGLEDSDFRPPAQVPAAPHRMIW